MIASNSSRAPLALAVATLLASVALVFAYAAPARAAICGAPVPYPGDDATQVDYANWMANGAVSLGIPGELPVMAALVESGLANLKGGDADSVGFFQMRTSIWDKGAYKGYATNPALQLKWFTDQAPKVRISYISAGKGDPAASDTSFGVWIADIERPAAQYRGRYQLRLAEARKLIAATCPGLQRSDLTPPFVKFGIPSKQRPARSAALVARVVCPDEPCNASATALLRLPGSRKVIHLTSDTTMLPAGRKAAVRVPIKRALRKRVKRALKSGATIRANYKLRVADLNGTVVTDSKRIRIAR